MGPALLLTRRVAAISGPARMLRGLALCIQVGLVGLHWWWFYVLARSQGIFGNVIFQYFALIGDQHYWSWRSLVIAVIGTAALCPLPVWCREVLIGAQIAWLGLVTVLLGMVRPTVTGPGAYAAFTYLATCLAVHCWRTRRNVEQ